VNNLVKNSRKTRESPFFRVCVTPKPVNNLVKNSPIRVKKNPPPALKPFPKATNPW